MDGLANHRTVSAEHRQGHGIVGGGWNTQKHELLPVLKVK